MHLKDVMFVSCSSALATTVAVLLMAKLNASRLVQLGRHRRWLLESPPKKL